MTWNGAGYTPPRPDDAITLFISGTPIQQGSKTAYVVGRRAVVTDQNRVKLKPWRAIVANAADIGHTFYGPVEVELHFHMPAPKKPRWNLPAVKPDLDKLVRAVLDGLTDGGLIEDDARVTTLIASKRYSTEPGVAVEVRPA